MHVSNRLVKIRKNKGHTLTEAAQEMGVGRQTVHCVEAGKKFPRPFTLEKLAQYYGIPEIEVLETILTERKRRNKVLDLYTKISV